MKLFVGNLAWSVDDQALREAFGEYGELDDARVITDRETGRSRGFGFVTFANGDDAQAAMSAMNGSEVWGRQLNVNEARERQPRREQW